MSPLKLTRRGFLKLAGLAAGLFANRRLSASGTTLLRSPYLMNLSDTSATILWTTSTPAPGSVLLQNEATGAQQVESTIREFLPKETGHASPYYQHQATITNLKPGARYSYQVMADGRPVACPAECSLRFRGPSDGDFSFLHFADSGSGNANQLQLKSQMESEDVALALANGDLAYDNATFESVEANYHRVYRSLMSRIPFFPALGNHEYWTDRANPSLCGRVTPTGGVPRSDWGRYYAFDWGNVHFVALDSNEPLTKAAEGNGEMLRFLERSLQRTRKFWRVVYFHHPPYATGKHQDEPEAALVRRHIVPILEKYGVQLVLCGHEHAYQRTHSLLDGAVVGPGEGIVYITSGGGGADTLYTPPNELVALSSGAHHYVRADVTGPTMTLRAKALGEAGEIDVVRLAPKPQITSAPVNSASFTPNLASGGAITIFGRNLCASERIASTNSITEAAGTVATLNGEPIPLLYAGPDQINAQIPFSVSGEANLEITTLNGSVRMALNVAPVAPAIFLTPQGYAIARRLDGTLVDAAFPARPLETIVLYATGLGEVSGNRVVAEIRVLVGDVEASSTAAMSADRSGVYEIEVQLPGTLRAGLASIQVLAGGSSSNVAVIHAA